MVEPTIVRSAVFVVHSSSGDHYGNLIVTDKEGTAHKIGKKREHLFSVFQDDYAVEVGYAVYMDKEYIATAHEIEGELPPPTAPSKLSPEQQAHIDKAKEAVTEPVIDERTKDIHRQVALKEVGELYRAGFLVEDEAHPIDRKLIARYKNWICKTLGIDVQYKS